MSNFAMEGWNVVRCWCWVVWFSCRRFLYEKQKLKEFRNSVGWQTILYTTSLLSFSFPEHLLRVDQGRWSLKVEGVVTSCALERHFFLNHT